MGKQLHWQKQPLTIYTIPVKHPSTAHNILICVDHICGLHPSALLDVHGPHPRHASSKQSHLIGPGGVAVDLQPSVCRLLLQVCMYINPSHLPGVPRTSSLPPGFPD